MKVKIKKLNDNAVMPTNPVGTLWEANTIVLTASRLMTRTISLPQTERYGTEIPMS